MWAANQEFVMDELSFYRQLGFKANPFQYTNADEEDYLKDYFIPPPYFQSVWGDPSRPSSCVIFAPRGGGKSAQRKMIEIRSIASNVLALQYSRFEFSKDQSVQDITLDYHLKNINRICLIAFLMQVYEKNMDSLTFDSTERAHIRTLCEFYLADLNADSIINAANSIMTLYDKAKEFFKRNLWAINSILDNIFKKIGLTTAKDANAKNPSIAKPSKTHLEIIISLIKSLGVDSIYILIDKVDETALTGNDAKASFTLIEPLIRDLELLQMKGIGFKFFLWNELYPYYKKYARPDRVPQFELNWNSDQLSKMMKLRLTAYSSDEKEPIRFYNILDPQMSDRLKRAVTELIITFSHASPRDMIRVCQQMVTEQLRINPMVKRITITAATDGFNVFCQHRAKEVVSSDHIMNELQKNHRLDFTVNFVANEKFKISTNAARTKIQTWVNTGVVKYIDDIQINGSKRPVHHYAVVDARVAKSIFPELSFVNFLKDKIRTCDKCGSDMFRDWDLSSNHICQNCKVVFRAETVPA